MLGTALIDHIASGHLIGEGSLVLVSFGFMISSCTVVPEVFDVVMYPEVGDGIVC